VIDLRDQLQSTLGTAFSISRELGGGGMSRVFVARDEALGRDVVVKVIAPENAEGLSAERFAREVKLAARLQQANIVPVLSAGTSGNLPYYTMPFVRGESLRARIATGVPLSISEAVSILRDVARALAYAHAEGVVHRDIKPENILLSGGAAVVTDFGIAKAMDASRTQEDISVTGITRVGMSLGTPAYMSPEQALGDPGTDARADIYAWGVVAWELLGGAHPFAGKTTTQALIAAHVAEAPPSLLAKRPEVPEPLARLVMRCLEKNPANRPQSADELLASLESVNTSQEKSAPASRARAPRRTTAYVIGAAVSLVAVAAFAYTRLAPHSAPIAADKSLAVLPFAAIGGDTADSYLGEGISDEVRGTLAQLPGLRLAGRSSAARSARSGASLQDIATSLGVSEVLDGSVRRERDRIRVTAELTNGADGVVTWRDSYDRPAADIFAVQDEIARAIAVQLQVALSGAGASAAGGTRDAAAYDLYLKGMYLYRRRGAGLAEAISNLEQATVRDSTFARAWAGLSSALTVEPNYLDVHMGEVLPRARDAADRAVRLDSTLSEAHLALGYVLAESFDWVPAEAELRRAIALDPAAVEPRYRLGYLLSNMHRPAEAVPVLQQAKARDPMYFLVSVYLGGAQVDVGQFAEGIAEERRGIELEPKSVAALSTLARGYSAAAMPDSATAVARRLVAATQSPGRLGTAAFVLARSGQRQEAEAIIRRLLALPEGTWTRASGLSMAYMGLRDTTRAVQYMERAAAGDGDLFVLFSTLTAAEIPRSDRTDAVWRRFHLDPARMAAPAHSAQRPIQ
jgi:TolB-like protein/tRNA A-37 threonylcarbamoyl transferase component Bud32/Flp pilus assembly protein TadD